MTRPQLAAFGMGVLTGLVGMGVLGLVLVLLDEHDQHLLAEADRQRNEAEQAATRRQPPR